MIRPGVKAASVENRPFYLDENPSENRMLLSAVPNRKLKTELRTDVIWEEVEKGRRDKQSLRIDNSKQESFPDAQIEEAENREQPVGNENNVEGGETFEDGEIDDSSHTENLDNYSCRFYQKGLCVWGRKCHFFHLSDKGLYNMFDASPVFRESNSCHVNLGPVCDLVCQSLSEETEAETAWDQDLKEAMERVKESSMRKGGSLEFENLCMTIQKDGKYIDMLKSPRKTRSHSRKSPVPKATFWDTPECGNNRKEQRRHADKKPKSARSRGVGRTGCCSDWRDPWRRSKSKSKRRPSRSVSDSSHSRFRSCSSFCERSTRKYRKRARRSPRRPYTSTSSHSSSPNSRFKKVSTIDIKRGGKMCGRITSKTVKSRQGSDSAKEVTAVTLSTVRRAVTRRSRSRNRKRSPDDQKRSSVLLGERRDVRHPPSLSSLLATKFDPLSPHSSDMSISTQPDISISDKSNLKAGLSENEPTVEHPCQRSLSDMSISSPSDASSCCPDEHPERSRPVCPELESDAKKTCRTEVGQSVVKASTMSSRLDGNYTTGPKASVQARGKKFDLLERDLLRYQGNSRRTLARSEGSKGVTSKGPAATKSKVANVSDQQGGRSASVRKGPTGAGVSRPSKKEILLQLLRVVNAAIERKRAQKA